MQDGGLRTGIHEGQVILQKIEINVNPLCIESFIEISKHLISADICPTTGLRSSLSM